MTFGISGNGDDGNIVELEQLARQQTALATQIMEFAYREHLREEMRDKTDIGHLVRIAMRAPLPCKPVALLYKVLLDTTTTPDDLLVAGLDPGAVDDIVALTPHDETFEEYSRRLLNQSLRGVMVVLSVIADRVGDCMGGPSVAPNPLSLHEGESVDALIRLRGEITNHLLQLSEDNEVFDALYATLALNGLVAPR